MKRAGALVVAAGTMLLSAVLIDGQTAATPAAPTQGAGPVTVPDDIVWETNNDDPPIGSPDAIRGGTFNFFMTS